MADIDVDVHDWEPRHNIVAFLEDGRDSAAPYRPMIAFLRRSRIFTAITAQTIIYKDQVGAFWSNAVINYDLPFTRIISRVADQEIILSEQIIRDLFQLNDDPDMPVLFPNTFINGGMIHMGYPGIPIDQYRKANLTRVWRYLMHIMIVCLSSRKAGFDGISHSTASDMLSLVYNKPFNFSGYIFRAMVDNVHAGDNRWNMYPRFIQLLINQFLPDLPVNAAQCFRLTPMNIRIFAICGSYGRGVPVPDDVPLFGHIVNEDYVPPVDHGYMDDAAAPQQPPEDVFVNVPVQEVNQPVDELLLDIENFQHVEEPAQQEASNDDDDGGSTPSDSDGAVPRPEEMENLHRFYPQRFKRVQRRIRQGRMYVPPDT